MVLMWITQEQNLILEDYWSMEKVIQIFIGRFTWKKLFAAFLGNIILGLGEAVLRISGMGNDPYTAMMMAISAGFSMGLGNFQLLMNLILLVVQLVIGMKYLGFGALINLFMLGYMTQGFTWVFMTAGITGDGMTIILQLIVMAVALIILSFGLSMYQAAGLGASPYDFLSMWLAEHFRIPYFAGRIITDGSCVTIILVAVLTGFIAWSGSHLGVGTVLTAFCLGPLVHLFMKLNGKWINAVGI